MFSSLELVYSFLLSTSGEKGGREYWMPGVMEWGKLLCHRYLVDYDDDVICVFVYILIYAFFLDMLFNTHQIRYLNCVRFWKYINRNIEQLYLSAGKVLFCFVFLIVRDASTLRERTYTETSVIHFRICKLRRGFWSF